MEFDLPKIAQWMMDQGLMERAFLDFTRAEVIAICEKIHEETIIYDYTPPYIKDGSLFISENAHPIYRYWTPGGQALEITLRGMGVSEEMIEKYSPKQDGEGIAMTE